MTGAATQRESIGDRIGRVGGAPGLMVAAGVLSILIGVLVLAWPGVTIKIIAWLFAIQLIIAGVLQLIAAFSPERGQGGRVLFALVGALSVLVGLLCLREPLQTALVIGLLIGAMWVIQGVVGVVDAVGSERNEGRGWMIASAVLSIIGGVIVLVYPGASLVVLTWLFGIVLIVVGILLVTHGVTARRAGMPAPAAAHS